MNHDALSSTVPRCFRCGYIRKFLKHSYVPSEVRTLPPCSRPHTKMERTLPQSPLPPTTRATTTRKRMKSTTSPTHTSRRSTSSAQISVEKRLRSHWNQIWNQDDRRDIKSTPTDYAHNCPWNGWTPPSESHRLVQEAQTNRQCVKQHRFWTCPTSK